MNFLDYKFVEIGEFKISKIPLEVIYGGKADKVTVELELYSDKYKQIGESVYLIVLDGEPHYVGEYSKNLDSRWFKKENYIWHHKDIHISKALNNGAKVKLFLIDSPFINLENGNELNISKSIEHDILKKKNLKWNKRNNSLEKVSELRLEECIKL